MFLHNRWVGKFKKAGRGYIYINTEPEALAPGIAPSLTLRALY